MPRENERIFLSFTCRCSQGKSFYHMSNSLNASISDYRHSKTSGILRDLVHWCTLGPSTRHYWETRPQCDGWEQNILNTVKFIHFYVPWLSMIVPSCVIQIEPHPIPTLRASTPASMRFLAWAAVTTRERQRHRKVTKERHKGRRWIQEDSPE